MIVSAINNGLFLDEQAKMMSWSEWEISIPDTMVSPIIALLDVKYISYHCLHSV